VAALIMIAFEYGAAVFFNFKILSVFAHASFPLTLFVMWSMYQS
jgi:hypothetical protein